MSNLDILRDTLTNTHLIEHSHVVGKTREILRSLEGKAAERWTVEHRLVDKDSFFYKEETYADKDRDELKLKMCSSPDDILVRDYQDIHSEDSRTRREIYEEVIFQRHSQKFRDYKKRLSKESERLQLQPLHRGQADFFMKRRTPESILYEELMDSFEKGTPEKALKELRSEKTMINAKFPDGRRQLITRNTDAKTAWRDLEKRSTLKKESYLIDFECLNPKEIKKHLEGTHKEFQDAFSRF